MSRSNFRQTAPERPQPHIAVISAGLPASSSRPASARRRPGRSTRLRELYSRTIRSKSAMVCPPYFASSKSIQSQVPALRSSTEKAPDSASNRPNWPRLSVRSGNSRVYLVRRPRRCAVLWPRSARPTRTQGESASSRSSACAGGGEVRTRSRQRRCRHLMRLLGTLLLACRE